MAVEIRELVIKTTVGDQNKSTANLSRPIDKPDIQSLVNTCVAEVLKIMQSEKER
ncbi:MAG: DUF5908 family protein [Bacillota bacterium]